MDNISVFLGPKGLTSSEANHVSNVIKELVKDLDAGVTKNFRLSTQVIYRGGEKHKLTEGTKIDFKGNLIKKSRFYSLSSWLKEGIKAKETLVSGVSVMPRPVEQPVLEVSPSRPQTGMSDYLATLSVKEVAEYYAKEAYAAHIGTFIHNFDTIRQALEEYTETMFHPVSENEVLTVKNTLLYTKEELLEGYFELQKEHREAERVVNLYKARHKDWEKEVIDEYSKEIRKINLSNEQIMATFRKEAFDAKEEAATEERRLRKEASDLKIIIPHDLQEILDEVQTYSKK